MKYIKTEKGFYQMDNLVGIRTQIDRTDDIAIVSVEADFKSSGYWTGEISEQYIEEIPKSDNYEEITKGMTEEQEDKYWDKEFREFEKDYEKHLNWVLGKFINDNEVKVLDLEQVYRIYCDVCREKLNNPYSFQIRKYYY